MKQIIVNELFVYEYGLLECNRSPQKFTKKMQTKTMKYNHIIGYIYLS